MNQSEKIRITVKAIIHAPLEKVWQCWTEPEHITQWNFASPDWHAPDAINDLKVGGKFSYRMEARDGSMGFDFGGKYDQVEQNEFIAYTMDDGRKAEISFEQLDNKVQVVETFEAETQNSVELQQAGWQAILDNFKKYVEETA